MIGSGDCRSAALLALGVAAALGGCSKSSKSSHAAVARPPVTATFARTPKALLAASSMVDPALRLHEVDPDDVIRRVEFEDADGNPVPVAITVLEALSREWIWVELTYDEKTATGDAYPVSRKALLRVADGKLFNADGLDPWNAQVKGGTLYAYVTGQDELVRIDLASMLEVPINNPAYDRVLGPFLVDHHGNVRVEVWANSAAPKKIFLADNAPPVLDPWLTWGGGEFCRSDTLATVYGEDGRVYAVCSVWSVDPDPASTASFTNYFVLDVEFTTTGTQTHRGPNVRTVDGRSESPIRAATPYRLDSRSRHLPLTTGFFTMTPVAGGGISLAWTDLALPPSLSVIAGDYGYWQSGETISRIHFQAGASAEAMVTAPNLISWKVAGGVLVFTQYLTGTAVGTYQVAAPGVDPELISSSDMQVQHIIELDPSALGTP